MPRKKLDVARFHAEYDWHPDDRVRLFRAVAELIRPMTVLYPGSYVDIGPSVAFDDVVYVDTDKRAERFFDQTEAVEELIIQKRTALPGSTANPFTVRFHAADYRKPLPVQDGSVQFLVSLYAGFVSEYCTRYLADGGWLLANNSHGDASMATLNPDYSLFAVINSRSESYRPSTRNLETYLIPKRGQPPTVDDLHRTNRGIAYTKAPFAYLFQKTDH